MNLRVRCWKGAGISDPSRAVRASSKIIRADARENHYRLVNDYRCGSLNTASYGGRDMTTAVRIMAYAGLAAALTLGFTVTMSHAGEPALPKGAAAMVSSSTVSEL